MTKKIFAILMALVLTLAMCTTAMAEEATIPETSKNQANITKIITATNADSIYPTETFKFSFTAFKAEKTSKAVATTEMPTIGEKTVEFTAPTTVSTAGQTYSGNVYVDLSDVTFPGVGVYTYKVTETDNKTLGYTYSTSPVYLVVTVINQDGVLKVGAVHYSESISTSGDKTGSINNTYSAGKLTISKVLSGNMTEADKYFDVTVVFSKPDGSYVNSTMTVSGGSDASNHTTATIGENHFKLKGGDTITISNIPYGVTYTIAEADYTAAANGGYETPTYTMNGASATVNEAKEISGAVDSDTDAVVITNTKNQGTIDTGISLDSLPYIIVLGAALIGLAVVIVKKRMASSDDDQ